MEMKEYIWLAGVVVAFISFCIAWKSVKTAADGLKHKNHFDRVSKALSYSLYAAEHLRESRLQIGKLFGERIASGGVISLEDLKAEFSRESELQQNVLILFAHWENMALAINMSIADEETARRMVFGTLTSHVSFFESFISDRKRANSRAYENLTGLHLRWLKKNDDANNNFSKPTYHTKALNNN